VTRTIESPKLRAALAAAALVKSGMVVGLGSGSMDQPLPVTLILDRNGNTVKRFDGLTKPEEIRAAIAKAQNAG